MKRIPILIPEEDHYALWAKSITEKTSMSELIRKAIKAYLKK